MTRAGWVRVGLVLVLAAGCTSDSAPALEGPDPTGNWTSQGGNAGVGEVMSIGSFVAAAPKAGGKVVLRKITLDGNEGLDLVGITLNGPKRSWGMVGVEVGYPLARNADDVLPLPGAVVPSGPTDEDRRRGVAVTFGLKRSAPGMGTAAGFTVEYSVDGKTRRQSFKTGITLCALEGYDRLTDRDPPCQGPPRPT